MVLRLSSFLTFLAALTALTGQTSMTNAADEPLPVYKTEPITIDGNLDKPVWQKAVRIPINYELHTNNAEPSKIATGSYMLAWDAHYLYIAYDWTSDTKPASGTGGDERGPKDNKRKTVLLSWAGKNYDCFEFFVEIDNDDYHFWEIHHNDRNNLADYFCIRPRDKDDKIRNFMSPGMPVAWFFQCYIEDDGEFKLKSAVHEKTRKEGDKDVYAGYSAELRLPLKGLGADISKRGKDGFQLQGNTFRLFGAEARANKIPVYFHSVKGMTHGWFHDNLVNGQQWVFKDDK